MALPRWIKEHRYLRGTPMEQGEASVALLLLWEADHDMPFPCKAAELRTRVMTFANRLIDAAGAADSEHGSNTSLCASLSPLGYPLYDNSAGGCG